MNLREAGRMMADLSAGKGWVLETRPTGETAGDGDGPVLRTLVQGDGDCVVWASPEALERPELCQAHLEGMAEAVAAVRRFRRTVRWTVFGGRWAAVLSCGAGATELLMGQAPWLLFGLLAAAPAFFIRRLIRWRLGRLLKRL